MPAAKTTTNTSPPHHPTPSLSLPVAIVLTLALVIIVREGAVIVCQTFGIASAANIVGLIVMFVILMVWRFTIGLPQWLTQASNTLLVDSGFAFLPVSAGAGLLLFALGDEFWGIVITIIVSTLIPLWGFAQLANRWLNPVAEDATAAATHNLDASTESNSPSSTSTIKSSHASKHSVDDISQPSQEEQQ